MRTTVMKKAALALLGAGSAALCWCTPSAAASRMSNEAPLAVPSGITLVDEAKGEAYSRDSFLWRRLGDAQGKPLYTYTLEGHSGTSHCFDACAKEFPPFLAPRNAAAFGDWSLVKRPEGRQWAYRGQPLYGYAGPPIPAPHFDIGNDTERGFAEKVDPSGPGFAPKPGWSQAVYDPVREMHTPADIRLELLEAAGGYAFVVAPTGLPLYLLNSRPTDTSSWTPFYASDLALPIEDFSKVRRPDGTHQWAYKGQPLYTYNGDYSSTDIGGVTQQGARIALAYRLSIPRELAINVYPTRPPMMTTASGLAVYTEAPYHLQYGGRETRGGYHYSYKEGKAVGTLGCLDECARTWRPVLAPANAQPSGFWEILSRADGSKQWAYKGSALYTYEGDKVPGDIKGNNKAVIMYGDANDRLATVLGEGFSTPRDQTASTTSATPVSSATAAAATPTAAHNGPAGSIDLMSLVGGKALTPNEGYGAAFGAGFYWHLVPLYD